MRLLYIIAGSGKMECDVCLRDGLLARTFKSKGHDVLFAPMYTPLPDVISTAIQTPLFYGGINVFLQQKFPLFRRTPRLLDSVFNIPALINFVSRFGHLTQARDLAEMTISVMEGAAGNQAKELEILLDWLKTQPRPDAVILPTSLLAGLAAPIRQSLGAPVVCLLSGEDAFIDQFPEPWRARTLEVLRRHARSIDGFLAASRYYAEFMTDYLNLEPGSVRTMTAGIDTAAYGNSGTGVSPVILNHGRDAHATSFFTIGYRSQICEVNGLHILAEALRILKSNPATAACRVRAAGHLAPADRPYLKKIQENIRDWGLEADFEYVGELSPAGRIEFLKGLDAFTVPAIYPEPTGLYVPEALAAGVPVVLPRVGCLPEWIDATQAGLLIDRADPQLLANALGRLIAYPDHARAMGQAGRVAINRDNTLEKMADSILEALTPFRSGD